MKIEVVKTINVPDIEDCNKCSEVNMGSFINQCHRFHHETLKNWFIESKQAIKPCPACMEARQKANEKA